MMDNETSIMEHTHSRVDRIANLFGGKHFNSEYGSFAANLDGFRFPLTDAPSPRPVPSPPPKTAAAVGMNGSQGHAAVEEARDTVLTSMVNLNNRFSAVEALPWAKTDMTNGRLDTPLHFVQEMSLPLILPELSRMPVSPRIAQLILRDAARQLSYLEDNNISADNAMNSLSPPVTNGKQVPDDDAMLPPSQPLVTEPMDIDAAAGKTVSPPVTATSRMSSEDMPPPASVPAPVSLPLQDTAVSMSIDTTVSSPSKPIDRGSENDRSSASDRTELNRDNESSRRDGSRTGDRTERSRGDKHRDRSRDRDSRYNRSSNTPRSSDDRQPKPSPSKSKEDRDGSSRNRDVNRDANRDGRDRNGSRTPRTEVPRDRTDRDRADRDRADRDRSERDRSERDRERDGNKSNERYTRDDKHDRPNDRRDRDRDRDRSRKDSRERTGSSSTRHRDSDRDTVSTPRNGGNGSRRSSERDRPSRDSRKDESRTESVRRADDDHSNGRSDLKRPRDTVSADRTREEDDRERRRDNKQRKSERDVRDVKDRDVRDVKDRDVRDVRDVKDRDVRDVKDRDVRDVKDRDVKDRDVRDVKDRDVRDVKDRDVRDVKDRDVRDVKDRDVRDVKDRDVRDVNKDRREVRDVKQRDDNRGKGMRDGTDVKDVRKERDSREEKDIVSKDVRDVKDVSSAVKTSQPKVTKSSPTRHGTKAEKKPLKAESSKNRFTLRLRRLGQDLYRLVDAAPIGNDKHNKEAVTNKRKRSPSTTTGDSEVESDLDQALLSVSSKPESKSKKPQADSASQIKSTNSKKPKVDESVVGSTTESKAAHPRRSLDKQSTASSSSSSGVPSPSVSTAFALPATSPPFSPTTSQVRQARFTTEGTKLKRLADSMENKVEKATLYLQAGLKFVQSAWELEEQSRYEGSDANRLNHYAKQTYHETSAIFARHVSSFIESKMNQHAALSLQCKSYCAMRSFNLTRDKVRPLGLHFANMLKSNTGSADKTISRDQSSKLLQYIEHVDNVFRGFKSWEEAESLLTADLGRSESARVQLNQQGMLVSSPPVFVDYILKSLELLDKKT